MPPPWFGLRHGNKIRRPGHTYHDVHKNQWAIGGAMVVAWRQIGKTMRRSGELDNTERSLDLVCAVGRAVQIAQGVRLQDQWHLPALSLKFVGMHIFRNHDATPMFLRFGAVQSQVQESARFL